MVSIKASDDIKQAISQHDGKRDNGLLQMIAHFMKSHASTTLLQHTLCSFCRQNVMHFLIPWHMGQ